MDTEPQPTGLNPQPIYEQPVAPEPVPSEPAQPSAETPKSGRKGIIWGVLILLVLGIAASAIYFFMSGSSSTATPTPKPTSTAVGSVDTTDVQSDIAGADAAAASLDTSISAVNDGLNDQQGSLSE